MEENPTHNIKELTNLSKFGIQPDREVVYNSFSHKDWIVYWTDEKMLSSKNLDLIGPILKGIRLPEMVYGFNRFALVNTKRDFLFEVNPFDMLNLSSFKEREECYIQKNNQNQSSEKTGDDKFKRIYYIPKELKVQYAEKWKNVKVDRDDIIKSEPTTDWSYSSPYMGTIRNITSSVIYKAGIERNDNIKVEFTEEDIPLNR